MAAQITRTTKILLAILGVIIIAGIVVIVIIPRIGSKSTASQAAAGDNTTTIQIQSNNNSTRTSSTVKLSQEEEYRKLAEDKNFVSIFNNFEYPNSSKKEARMVEEDGSMFYIVLETGDSFEKVDNFYKSKKVQSIWSRSEIFETTSQELEKSFLNSSGDSSQSTEENNKYSKYSYISANKDKLLNVLSRSYSPDVTQIMIIYWQLSN